MTFWGDKPLIFFLAVIWNRVTKNKGYNMVEVMKMISCLYSHAGSDWMLEIGMRLHIVYSGLVTHLITFTHSRSYTWNCRCDWNIQILPLIQNRCRARRGIVQLPSFPCHPYLVSILWRLVWNVHSLSPSIDLPEVYPFYVTQYWLHTDTMLILVPWCAT